MTTIHYTAYYEGQEIDLQEACEVIEVSASCFDHLDEVIQDAHSKMASKITNQDLMSKLKWLHENGYDKEILEMIDECKEEMK